MPRPRDVALLEALDRWVRSLAATLATGRSVTDALRVSRRTAPPLLADEVDLRLRTRAVGLEVDGRRVHTTGGLVPYDGLVVATGARARRIGRPDQAELVLRSAADCARVREHLPHAGSVLVVGGGFLGMEIASTCRGLRCAAPWPTSASQPPAR